MNRRELFAGAGAAIAGVALAGRPVRAQEEYELVLAGGRVMDPESGLDGVRHVGIRAGQVAAISEAPLRGKAILDARGLVVAPGFIDLHAHGQDLENNRAQARDGVTTALELEVGVGDVARWYSARAGRRLLNYGASIGHPWVRAAVKARIDPADERIDPIESGHENHEAATDAETAAMRARVAEGLKQGALAVGFGLQYTPGASRWEVLEMFRAAAEAGAACHVHLRYQGLREPESCVAALEEVLAATALTGAPLHVVHVSSMGLRGTPRLLQMVREARGRGLDVTTECYPYTAGQTNLKSALFDDGWQERMGIGYGDLQWVATGERLTAATFAKYRETGGSVILHAIPEEMARLAVASPLTAIATDGHLRGGKGHPRGAGSYARVLGRYVREQGVLTLMDALRKASLLPAQRLERRCPAMKQKGRVRPGADADLTLFDPARVVDRATYADPVRPSEGIVHVLVDGVPVVRDGRLVDGTFPGRAVRAVPAG